MRSGSEAEEMGKDTGVGPRTYGRAWRRTFLRADFRVEGLPNKVNVILAGKSLAKISLRRKTGEKL